MFRTPEGIPPRSDATILRVCKKLNEDATSMLYAEDLFQFKITEWAQYGSPWAWVDLNKTFSSLNEDISVFHLLNRVILGREFAMYEAVVDALRAIRKQ